VRAVSWVAGLAALVGSGAYLLVYVYRWEWHRALLVGVLFLAALVSLGTALVLRRLGRLERRLREQQPPARSAGPDPRARLREAPVDRPAFRWLHPGAADRTHIFIPVLLGGGVLVSGVAWLVERIAGSAARSGVEEELAGELRQIAFPGTPLAPPDSELLAGADPSVDDPALRLLLGPGDPGRSR
jgi:hypothetical protein